MCAPNFMQIHPIVAKRFHKYEPKSVGFVPILPVAVEIFQCGPDSWTDQQTFIAWSQKLE